MIFRKIKNYSNFSAYNGLNKMINFELILFRLDYIYFELNTILNRKNIRATILIKMTGIYQNLIEFYIIGVLLLKAL